LYTLHLECISRPSGKRVVRLHTDRSRADRYSRVRLLGLLTSPRNECVMYRDVVQVPRPNQEAVRRIGGALVAMAASLDHQPQVVLMRKIDRCRNIIRISCRDCVNAWLGSSGIDPSQSLRETWLIAYVIWISQVIGEKPRCGAPRIGLEDRKRKIHWNQISADILIQSLPGRW